LRFLSAVRCPVLVTLGSLEVQNSLAFRGAAEAIAELRRTNVTVEVVGGADHFYSGVRGELFDRLRAWLRADHADPRIVTPPGSACAE
jgi:hypothetical protein